MNYFILFYFFEVTSSHPSQVRKLLHFFDAKLGRHHIWEVDFFGAKSDHVVKQLLASRSFDQVPSGDKEHKIWTDRGTKLWLWTMNSTYDNSNESILTSWMTMWVEGCLFLDQILRVV